MEQNYISYVPLDYIKASSVLVFAPHPDDEVFGCGGSLKKHSLARVPIKVIIVTDGNCGLANSQSNLTTPNIRQEESQKAAKILGYGSPTFWGLSDRELHFEEALIRKILELLKETRADLVYGPSLYEIHPDHRHLSWALVEALRRYDRDIVLAMYEIGAPFRPNTLLDVTDVWTFKKEAMATFKSQIENQPYHEQIAGLNRYRTYTLPKDVERAEAYFIVSSTEIKKEGPLRLIEQLSFENPLKGSINAHPLIKNSYNGYGAKVSILVRSLDRPTLKEALKSIEQQTYPNIKVLVVNAKGKGHSKIETGDFRFNIQFIDSERPLSRTEAGNLALSRAHGDFLLFLDDDDFLMPDHIHSLVEALSREPSKLLAYSKVMCVDQNGQPLNKIIGHEYDSILLLAGNYIPIHAALFSRSLVEAGIRMDEAFDLYEDWDLWIQAAQYSDFIFVPKITACYRIGQNSGMGITPEPSKRKEAASAIFKKWRHLWTSEKLKYVLDSVGEENIDPYILDEAREYLGQRQGDKKGARIAVVLHIYYEDLWPELRSILKNIPFKFDLYITLSGKQASEIAHVIKNEFQGAQILNVKNRGRDILPFLNLLPTLIKKGYNCALKLHTKKSLHFKKGDEWRQQIFKEIVGTRELVREIVTRFKREPQLGLLGPSSHYISCSKFLDTNLKKLIELSEQIQPNSTQYDWNFFAGSMFWFRPAALMPLVSLGLDEEDFEEEHGQLEGTLAHTIERLFPIIVKAAGYEVDVTEDKKCSNTDFSYPFAPKSALYLLEEKDRLRKQVREVEAAKNQAEQIAAKRLDKIQKLEKEIKKLEDLALKRLEEISDLHHQNRELHSALKSAEEMAFSRLNHIKKLETALKEAQGLAFKRLALIDDLQKTIGSLNDRIEEMKQIISHDKQTISLLSSQLEQIQNHWLWRNAKKIERIWNKALGKKKSL